MFHLKPTSFKRALLAGAFLVIGGAAAHADYSVGSAAFNAGNYNRAYEEFKQSADTGNSLAQFMMGRLYAEGRGVIEDKVAAYMWYDLAASNGNTRAIAARDAIAAQLSSSEIDRAQESLHHGAAFGLRAQPQFYRRSVFQNGRQPYETVVSEAQRKAGAVT